MSDLFFAARKSLRFGHNCSLAITRIPPQTTVQKYLDWLVSRKAANEPHACRLRASICGIVRLWTGIVRRVMFSDPGGLMMFRRQHSFQHFETERWAGGLEKVTLWPFFLTQSRSRNERNFKAFGFWFLRRSFLLPFQRFYSLYPYAWHWQFFPEEALLTAQSDLLMRPRCKTYPRLSMLEREPLARRYPRLWCFPYCWLSQNYIRGYAHFRWKRFHWT